CQVPRLITGSFSPEEGMARDSILDDSPEDCARAACTCNNKPAAPALIMRTALRRDIPASGSPFLFSTSHPNAWFRKRNRRFPISERSSPCVSRYLHEETKFPGENWSSARCWHIRC